MDSDEKCDVKLSRLYFIPDIILVSIEIYLHTGLEEH